MLGFTLETGSRRGAYCSPIQTLLLLALTVSLSSPQRTLSASVVVLLVVLTDERQRRFGVTANITITM